MKNTLIYFSLFTFHFSLLTFSASATTYIKDGYADKQSYNPGEVLTCYINATNTYTNVKLKLFDVNGNAVDSVIVNLVPQTISSNSPWANGYGYAASFIYTVPALKSGY